MNRRSFLKNILKSSPGVIKESIENAIDKPIKSTVSSLMDYDSTVKHIKNNGNKRITRRTLFNKGRRGVMQHSLLNPKETKYLVRKTGGNVTKLVKKSVTGFDVIDPALKPYENRMGIVTKTLSRFGRGNTMDYFLHDIAEFGIGNEIKTAWRTAGQIGKKLFNGGNRLRSGGTYHRSMFSNRMLTTSAPVTLNKQANRFSQAGNIAKNYFMKAGKKGTPRSVRWGRVAGTGATLAGGLGAGMMAKNTLFPKQEKKRNLFNINL